MKVSDYIALFFSRIGVRHAFVVTGGAALHLIDGIDKTSNIDYICCHHEQSAAMAADAYSRITQNIGLAISSSGPGATNLITGICGCYYDSVPAFFITGQVSTTRMSNNSGVRQIGFQETPIVDIVKNFTNYAVQIKEPKSIRYELEKGFYMATNLRPGPVLIDVPDNIQRMEIDISTLSGFDPTASIDFHSCLETSWKSLKKKMRSSKRPVIIAGWGVHLSRSESLFLEFIDRLCIPVALTWGAADLIPYDHQLRIGTFGTHGSRYANFAVQNADFILAIGTRLDTKATGSPPSSFAREAWKSIVDISLDELQKFKQYDIHIDLSIHSDAKLFINHCLQSNIEPMHCKKWKRQVNHWKGKYCIHKEKRITGKLVNPYIFLKELSHLISTDAQIWSDTGSTIAWLMQAFEPIGRQRLWHDFNNTAMGWALPASIASLFAFPHLETYCLVGDGSLMMNLQELQTVITHELPLKIICFDNGGYSMIKQTQDQWLGGHYIASSSSAGLKIPDLIKVARSFGFDVERAESTSDAIKKISWLKKNSKPSFLLLKIDKRCNVAPQVKFGRPNEDQEPLLDRNIFKSEMIVEPVSTEE